MSLRINDEAPNFTATTTEGEINFHEWLGNDWAVLFSHPKDFTPVCTTELGYLAKLKPEFTKRSCKIIGLSVDPVDRHRSWLKDIEETQGHAVNYPIIADAELSVAKAYNMLPADEPGTADGRTADKETEKWGVGYAMGLFNAVIESVSSSGDIPELQSNSTLHFQRG